MGYICFATLNDLFEFSWRHGENNSVRVSPALDPRDSYDLVELLHVLGTSGQTMPTQTVDNWRSLARLPEPQMSLLEMAFHPTHFRDTRRNR
jgi:hypothetical protein